MILHDFRCEDCGVVVEHFVKSDVTSLFCEDCDGIMTRVILLASKPHWLSLAQGASASPEAIDKFERMHKQQKVKEDRTFKEHGDYGPAPGASGRSQDYSPRDLQIK